jgi:two-component system, cell cycle response regulator
MSSSIRRGWGSWGVLGVSIALTLVFAVHAFVGLGASSLDHFFGTWGELAIFVPCAAICLLRARSLGKDRNAWLLIGAGLGFWAAGGVYYLIAFDGPDPVPIPSVGDAFYLIFYLLLYCGIVLLARRRVQRIGAGMWLDGWIGALACGAVSGEVVIPHVFATSHQPLISVTTSLAYPIGDLMLLAIVLGVLTMTGWRTARALAVAGIGLAVFTISDSFYVVRALSGTYKVGTIIDVGWMIMFVCVAYAALAWSSDVKVRMGERTVSLIVPIVSGIAALVVLILFSLGSVEGKFGLACAVGALALTIIRMAFSVRENQQMLYSSRREADTDELTGLGNRRMLYDKLARVSISATEENPVAVVLLDLDGFKAYNDSRGHDAGDQLLVRVAASLRASLGDSGTAYRLGGDEFCVVFDPGKADPELAAAYIAGRLEQRRDRYAIGASFGCGVIPEDGRNGKAVLRRADVRMYERKTSQRPTAANQVSDALLAVIGERDRDLGEHASSVAELAVAIGRRLGIEGHELEILHWGAALHDVGKLAMPDAVLDKPSPLNKEEWALMCQHTTVGERVVAAAPALRAAAPLVRASHEHWDGGGYPDGLVGVQIPRGARIIAACDAFDAMTTERAYQAPRLPADALIELRRCAGTQFDPEVIEALVAVVTIAGPKLPRSLVTAS